MCCLQLPSVPHAPLADSSPHRGRVFVRPSVLSRCPSSCHQQRSLSPCRGANSHVSPPKKRSAFKFEDRACMRSHAFILLFLASINRTQSPQMFASSGLFSALPCPFQPHCPRESYCIYSHQHIIPAEDSTSSSSSSTVRSKPQRSTSIDGDRPREKQRSSSNSQTPASRDRPTPASKTGSSSSLTPSSSSALSSVTAGKRPATKDPNPPVRQSQVAAMEAAKRRRQTYDTVEPPKAPLLSTSSTPAVLLKRPDVVTSKTLMKKVMMVATRLQTCPRWIY